MKETALAYMAGFVDGEGCIRVALNQSGKYPFYQLTVRVYNTNCIVPNFFKQSFGEAVRINKRNNPNHRPLFMWQASCRLACSCLKQLEPYLMMKREQAQLAILFQEQKHKNKNLELVETINSYNRRGAEAIKHELDDKSCSEFYQQIYADSRTLGPISSTQN